MRWNAECVCVALFILIDEYCVLQYVSSENQFKYIFVHKSAARAEIKQRKEYKNLSIVCGFSLRTYGNNNDISGLSKWYESCMLGKISFIKIPLCDGKLLWLMH